MAANVVITSVYKNFFGKNEEVFWNGAFSGEEARVSDVVERFEDETAQTVYAIYCFLPEEACAMFDNRDAVLSELIPPFSRELNFMFQTQACCNCDKYDFLLDECDSCLKPFCKSCGIVRCASQSCIKTNSGLPSCASIGDPSSDTHEIERKCNSCRGYKNLKYE